MFCRIGPSSGSAISSALTSVMLAGSNTASTQRGPKPSAWPLTSQWIGAGSGRRAYITSDARAAAASSAVTMTRCLRSIISSLLRSFERADLRAGARLRGGFGGGEVVQDEPQHVLDDARVERVLDELPPPRVAHQARALQRGQVETQRARRHAEALREFAGVGGGGAELAQDR